MDALAMPVFATTFLTASSMEDLVAAVICAKAGNANKDEARMQQSTWSLIFMLFNNLPLLSRLGRNAG
jgi:hypothetical protein